MELDVFARFHAAPWQEERMAQVLRDQVVAVRCPSAPAEN